MFWKSLRAMPRVSGFLASGLCLSLSLPVLAASHQTETGADWGLDPLTTAAAIGAAQGGDRSTNSPSSPNYLAQGAPVAGVITRVEAAGGALTLRGRTVATGQTLSNPADRLRVPARSRANLGFRTASSGRTIPNYLVQAGSSTRPTEYWYSCNGRNGQFVMGWSAGGGASTCSQVSLGRPLRTSARPDGTLVATKQAQPASSQLKADFSDTVGHWAEAEIDALSGQGIISGYEDGQFRPDAPVTRAEFAAMVNKAFGNLDPVRAQQDFPDTRTHWASAAVRAAYGLGFISGYGDGSFQPNGNISRVEGVVALASGLNLSAECSPDSLGSVYGDAAQIPAWACGQVNAATASGIRIQGPGSSQFSPSRQASRADIAVLIYQALQGTAATAETNVVIEPATADTTWVWVDATDNSVEVTVLGGSVLVGPETGAPKVSVAAGERYSVAWTEAGILDDSQALVPLSEEERAAIANSPDVQTFLDPDSWSPEIADQLSQYQVARQALAPDSGPSLSATQPDLRVASVEISLIDEDIDPYFRQVRVVATIENVGGPFISGPEQQEIQFYQGSSYTLAETQVFQNLAPGESIQVVYEGLPYSFYSRGMTITEDPNAFSSEMTDEVSSEVTDESPPYAYTVVIVYDPDIDQDGNPENNQLTAGFGGLRSDLVNGPVTVTAP